MTDRPTDTGLPPPQYTPINPPPPQPASLEMPNDLPYVPALPQEEDS